MQNYLKYFDSLIKVWYISFVLTPINMPFMHPEPYYSKQIDVIQKKSARLHQRKSLLGWLRLITLLVAIISAYIVFKYGWIPFVADLVCFLLLYIRLVMLDLDNTQKISHQQHLLQINLDELKALNHEFGHFQDGQQYLPKDHFYAADLDIFGKASLFQYINRTTSDMGGARLATWLLNPADTTTLLNRQEAIKELSAQPEWGQEFQALGREKSIRIQTQHKVLDWLQQPESFFSNRHWNWARYVLPMVILSIVALNAMGIVTNLYRNFALIAFGIIAYLISKKVTGLHQSLSKISAELSVLSESVDWIEQSAFTSPSLRQIQSAFIQDNTRASIVLKKLNTLLDRFDLRYNPLVFIPLDVLLQWDLQQALELEKWKKTHKEHVEQWFEHLGQCDALVSLSVLQFNHPDWCFPTFSDDYFSLSGTSIGHPLIAASKCVCNDVSIQHSGEIMIITGSNMGGKSTYLRSIGVNIILAMAGAPVYAHHFRLSPVQLISSMRVADNLEENTSTFYAELKKLKTLIEMVNRGEKVFILLDEILRGTNSMDRHTGSVALIKQLIHKKAAGMIATHDVELAKMKEQYPRQILNYYFDVQVNQEELYFDYRLKPGICQSLNASLLMKKIGIELNG